MQLNLTRLGDNIEADIYNELNKALSVRSLLNEHIGTQESNPNLPVRTPTAIVASSTTATPATTLVATLAPRGEFSSIFGDGTSAIESHFSGAKSDGSSLTSRVGSDVSSATSRIASDASSITSRLASDAASALAPLKTDVMEVLNREFTDLKNDLGLKDWYSIHLLDYCEGYYVPNKTNSSVAPDGVPAPVSPGMKIAKNVTSCTKHTIASDFDPKVALLILYYVGSALTGLSLILSCISAFRFGWAGPFINVVLSLLAFFFLGVASALATGISVEAAKLITSLGKDFGIAAYKGSNFFKLTWTATALMLMNAVIWTLEFGHGFKNEFRSHLQPAWRGFRNGLTPGSRPSLYQREKFDRGVEPFEPLE